MKGLDDYIEGKYDPNAPFNQVSWVEQYENIIDQCDWITDEMLEDDDIYQYLGIILENIVDKFIGEKYYNRKDKYAFLLSKKDEITTEFKTQYDNSLKKGDKIIYDSGNGYEFGYFIGIGNQYYTFKVNLITGVTHGEFHTEKDTIKPYSLELKKECEDKYGYIHKREGF